MNIYRDFVQLKTLFNWVYHSALSAAILRFCRFMMSNAMPSARVTWLQVSNAFPPALLLCGERFADWSPEFRVLTRWRRSPRWRNTKHLPASRVQQQVSVGCGGRVFSTCRSTVHLSSLLGLKGQRAGPKAHQADPLPLGTFCFALFTSIATWYRTQWAKLGLQVWRENFAANLGKLTLLQQ